MFDYNSTKWRKKASIIRKRDDYLCQSCKVREGTEVHHLNPVKSFPKLTYENKNLITLCRECHNACHVRNTQTLSKLGQTLRKRYEGSTSMKVIVVCGLNASNYIRREAKNNDLICDPEMIGEAMCKDKDNPFLESYIFDICRLIIERAKSESMIDTLWIGNCGEIFEIDLLAFHNVEFCDLDFKN